MKKKKTHDLILYIGKGFLLDILLAGIIILLFGLAHHGFSAILYYVEQSTLLSATEPTVPTTETPATTAATTAPVITTAPIETTVPVETTEETIPDNRTQWQIQYADHFTDEIIVTDHSYSSPNVSITIETISYGEGNDKVTYHVADIYVASLECFMTHTPYGVLKANYNQWPLTMDAEADAILSVTGDYFSLHKTGFLMRNGEMYMNNTDGYDICVLYDTGVMETYEKYTYDREEILASGAVQIWNFGPYLLDENGKVREDYNLRIGLQTDDPRTGIGYYSPGHYCLIVVDGRQEGYSKGIRIEEFAKIFEDLGCVSAYNLDGGGSALMVYNDELYSKPCESRRIGDFIIVKEPSSQETDEGVNE